MGTLDERAAEFKRRLKDKTIKSIFKMMIREGLTLEDLQDYVPEPSLRERTLERRRVIQQKKKQRESLAKARQAKKTKEDK